MKKNILFQPYHINPKFIEGAYAGCRKFDLVLSICHPGTMKILDPSAFDGILSNKLDYIDAIRSRGGKAVCTSMLVGDTNLRRFDAAVACDEYAIGQLGAEYFLRKGYWNFACSLDSLREQVFVETLKRAGQKHIRVFPKPPYRPGTLAMRVEFLKNLPKPCAFFVQTVQFGEFWYEAVHQAGIRIPDELAVLGIDDIEYICDLLEPTLSSIDTSDFEHGYRMCEVLAKLLNNEPVEPVTLIAPQKRVIERASTDYFAVKNEKLRQMIRFACDHFTEGLSVQTLADQFSLPLRTVYKLFDRHLRNSPKRFLIELQLKRAEELMKHGNMKMSAVAKESGFATQKSFYSFFKEYHNATPKEWCCRR